MKNFFAILFCALLVNSTFGQIKDFNLNDYKLPVIDRRALEFNFELDGQNLFDNQKMEEYGSSEKSAFNLSNYTQMGYRSYKNSERLQSSQNYNLTLSPQINRMVDDDTIVDKKTTFSTGFSVSSINRTYFNNSFFFETDVLFSADYMASKTNYESDGTDINSWSSNIYLEIPLMIGKGRIEQIQDARLAVYILEDLLKTGRLAREPEKEEILEFAALISKLQNQRYFDYRLHRIYEIEQVDSFLQAKSLATQPDARYFTAVYDNWDYSGGPVRESGNRVSTGIVPLFQHERYNPTNSSDYANVSGGVRFLVNYLSAKPLNLKWQRDWEVEASYSYRKMWQEEKITDAKTNNSNHELTGIASYNLGYYPNSRTSIKTGIDLQLMRSFEDADYEGPNDRSTRDFEFGAGFHVGLNYYLSPQLRLIAEYSLNNNYLNRNSKMDVTDVEYLYSRDNYLRQNLEVRFTYMIF
jgi:hypothetical protein